MSRAGVQQRTLKVVVRPVGLCLIGLLILSSGYLCAFVANGWHQRGLALATCGALLLAVDPFLKSLKNREIAQLAKPDPSEPAEMRAAALEAQMQIFVEHSHLAFWATMIGAVVLAVGFLADFFSEADADIAATPCQVREAPGR